MFTWTPCHVDTRIQKISMTIGLFVWIRDQSLFGMKCWCSNEWFLHCPCNRIPTSYYRVSMQLSNCLVSWVISPTSGTELTHLEGRKQSPSSFTSMTCCNKMQWDANYTFKVATIGGSHFSLPWEKGGPKPISLKPQWWNPSVWALWAQQLLHVTKFSKLHIRGKRNEWCLRMRENWSTMVDVWWWFQICFCSSLFAEIIQID